MQAPSQKILSMPWSTTTKVGGAITILRDEGRPFQLAQLTLVAADEARITIDRETRPLLPGQRRQLILLTHSLAHGDVIGQILPEANARPSRASDSSGRSREGPIDVAAGQLSTMAAFAIPKPK